MKKIIIIIAFTSVVCSLITHPAFAHILESNGSIGAVLHIDPEDDPIVGQSAGFFFEFKDKQGKFNPLNCICTFSIYEGDKQIYSQPLFQNNTTPSLTSASLFYTFTQKDVYKVRVEGKPTIPNAFQPFSLEYDIRVSREPIKQSLTTQNPSQLANWFSIHLIHVAGGIIVFMFLIFALIKQQKDRR